MSSSVIKVDNLSKKFCRHLKRSMLYGSADIFRSMLNIPYDQGLLRKHEFWAIKDISFQVEKGETVGIIGTNGSGKSTLLRLLSGVFPPDEGRIVCSGRVGSLIAVGAGFHPHMTGRENIFLNGALLGMNKDEIKDKFSEIVNFSEIGDFLDAPVSTYSSGMYVRLGFSIAAHINPDILLIDEVLSVGDLSFRNKSMRKLGELRKNCATIFVSHDLPSVKKVSDRIVIIDRGKLIYEGNPDKGLEIYQNKSRMESLDKFNKELLDISNPNIVFGNGDITIINYGILDNNDNIINNIDVGDDINIFLDFDSKIFIENPLFGVGILDEGINTNIVYDANTFNNVKLDSIEPDKKYRALAKLKSVNLTPGTYALNLAIMDSYSDEIFAWKRGVSKGDNFKGFIVNGIRVSESYMELDSEWKLQII